MPEVSLLSEMEQDRVTSMKLHPHHAGRMFMTSKPMVVCQETDVGKIMIRLKRKEGYELVSETTKEPAVDKMLICNDPHYCKVRVSFADGTYVITRRPKDWLDHQLNAKGRMGDFKEHKRTEAQEKRQLMAMMLYAGRTGDSPDRIQSMVHEAAKLVDLIFQKYPN